MNSMVFTDRNKLTNMINTLLDSDDDEFFCDIHLYSEGQALILEWAQVPYSGKYGGRFKYVDEDEVVMYEGRFPDNHYEFFYSEEEYKEALKAYNERGKEEEDD